jgi:hypothetical protein
MQCNPYEIVFRAKFIQNNVYSTMTIWHFALERTHGFTLNFNPCMLNASFDMEIDVEIIIPVKRKRNILFSFKRRDTLKLLM